MTSLSERSTAGTYDSCGAALTTFKPESAMLMSEHDSTDTIQPQHDIVNDQTGPGGRRVAWTQKQR